MRRGAAATTRRSRQIFSADMLTNDLRMQVLGREVLFCPPFPDRGLTSTHDSNCSRTMRFSLYVQLWTMGRTSRVTPKYVEHFCRQVLEAFPCLLLRLPAMPVRQMGAQ